MKTTLVIMAAGMGSRFGGLKQIEPVGLHGEVIADYSIFDAKRAGFNKIVFVIKKENEDIFNECVINHISKHIETQCVFQEMDFLPKGFSKPDARTKPWGTGHAVLSCCNAVNENFAVINADDFYGLSTFTELHKHLTNPANSTNTNNYAMVGFKLENTITEHGTVSRGICTVDSESNLLSLNEIEKIQKFEDGIKYYESDNSLKPLPNNAVVSMNAWGFTPNVFKHLNERFVAFLSENQNNLKAEFYLPMAICDLLEAKIATAKVLPSKDKWYGVTYKEDTESIKSAIKNFIKDGIYPERLWV